MDTNYETWANQEGDEMRGCRGAALTARAEAAGLVHVHSERLLVAHRGNEVWYTWDAVAGPLWEARTLYSSRVGVNEQIERRYAVRFFCSESEARAAIGADPIANVGEL